LKLYHFPIAPNPTKVRIYLAEKGIEIEQVVVNLVKGEQKSPEHLARNPFGSLPVLELDDGTHLTESLPIIELFEELYPDPPMIGTDPFERARVRRLERIADLGVLLPVARIIHATRSPLGLPPVPEIAEAARRGLPKALEVLDAAIGDRPFLAGEHPTIADCTLFAALGFARFGEVAIDPAYRNLGRWSADFGERPSANL
jgi:glutathione S-transferase